MHEGRLAVRTVIHTADIDAPPVTRRRVLHACAMRCQLAWQPLIRIHCCVTAFSQRGSFGPTSAYVKPGD